MGHHVDSNLAKKILTHFSHLSLGNFKGVCKQIDHFPEDADYEADTAEYFLRKSTDCLNET